MLNIYKRIKSIYFYYYLNSIDHQLFCGNDPIKCWRQWYKSFHTHSSLYFSMSTLTFIFSIYSALRRLAKVVIYNDIFRCDLCICYLLLWLLILWLVLDFYSVAYYPRSLKGVWDRNHWISFLDILKIQGNRDHTTRFIYAPNKPIGYSGQPKKMGIRKKDNLSNKNPQNIWISGKWSLPEFRSCAMKIQAKHCVKKLVIVKTNKTRWNPRPDPQRLYLELVR